MLTTDLPAERCGPRHRWMATATVMLGTLSMVLASTIVNVAIPDVMADFGIDQASAQWLATGYLAAMAAAMLANAWFVAAFGVRAAYVGAMAAFLAASVMGSLSPSLDWLIAARVLQGATAGIVQPLAMIVIFEVFPANQRGRGMGIYGLGVVLGPAVGPTLGGLLVDAFSWRAVFLIALPTVPAGIALAMTYLRGRTEAGPKPKLDVTGLVLLAAGLIALLWSLSGGQQFGWGDPGIVFGLSAALVLGLLFVVWERRCRDALVDLRVFRSPGFAGGFLLSMAVGAGLFGSTYLLPLFVQEVQGLSATWAGLVLMPAGLAMAAVFPLAGQLADRRPAPQVILAGLVLFALSCALLTRVQVTTGLPVLVVWVVLGRIGLGLMMPPVSTGSLALMGVGQIPTGAGLVNFGRQFGGALGVNLASMILEHSTAQHLQALAESGAATKPMEAMAAAGLAAPWKELSIQAATLGFQDSFLFLVLCYVGALLPLWLLHRGQRTTTINQ